MAKTLYYNPVTEEMEFVNSPSPLRENLGQRFFAAKGVSGGWWGDWELNYKDQMTFEEYKKALDIDKNPSGLEKAEGGRIDMKPGGIVEPGVTNYGRPLGSKDPKSGLGKIREYLKQFKKGTKLDGAEIAKLFNYDRDAVNHLIKAEGYKALSVKEKAINRANTFVSDFIKKHKIKPTQQQIHLGAGIDEANIREYIQEGKVKKVQPTVYDISNKAIDHILNTKNPTLNDIKKITKGGKGFGLGQQPTQLLTNIYRGVLDALKKRFNKIDSPRSVYKDFTIGELDLLKNKIRAVPGFEDLYTRDIRALISDAYPGNKNKAMRLKALKKVNQFFELRDFLKNKFGLNMVLDHPLSYDFVKRAQAGENLENLIRVRPLPDRVNMFKSNLDSKLIDIADAFKKNPGSKEVISQYQDLQEVSRNLEIKIGKISQKGNIISFEASKLGKEKLIPDIKKAAGIQNKFIEFIKNIKKNKAFQRLNINLDKLTDLSKTKFIDSTKYVKEIDKWLLKNPHARKLAVPILATVGLYKMITPSKADTLETGDEKAETTLGEYAAGVAGIGTGAAITKYPEKIWEGAKKVGKYGIVRPVAALALPVVKGAESLWETKKAIEEKRAPDYDLDNPMTYMGAAFWNWAIKEWGLDKTVEHFGKSLKTLSKGDQLRVFRNWVGRGLLSPKTVQFISSRLAWPIFGLTSGYKLHQWAKENLDWDPLTEEQQKDIQTRKEAAPKMLDTYEQASQIAKEQRISYEDALKLVNKPDVPGINFEDKEELSGVNLYDQLTK